MRFGSAVAGLAVAALLSAPESTGSEPGAGQVAFRDSVWSRPTVLVGFAPGTEVAAAEASVRAALPCSEVTLRRVTGTSGTTAVVVRCEAGLASGGWITGRKLADAPLAALRPLAPNGMFFETSATAHVERPRLRRVDREGFLVIYEIRRPGEIRYRVPFSTVYVPLLWIAAAVAIGFGLLRALVRHIEASPRPVPERVHNVNRALLGGIVVLEVVVGVVFASSALFTGLAATVATALGALPRSGFVRSALAITVLMVLMAVAILASYVAVAPTLRRVRHLEEEAAEGRRPWLRVLALVLVPPTLWLLALAAITSVAHNSAVLRLVGEVLVLGLLAALGPGLARLALPTRDADDATRRRLLALCARHGLRVRDVRLYAGRGQRQANALFVGIWPSHRYIYVSDYLLENLTEAELDAIISHEIGHGKEHHLLMRLGLFAVALLLNLVPGGAFVGLVIIGYLVFGLGIRLEKRADDYAARAVGAEATISALRRLAELNDTPLRTGRVWNSLTRHPGVAQRIERLGGDLPGAPQRPT